jgi:HEPN domain-containing protein
MTPLTREWVAKAENDFNSAKRLARARKLPDFDGASFHAQQCAEKYMKARLQESAVAFPKSHDLVVLLALILPLEPTFPTTRPQLDLLTKCTVEIRYPGRSATKADARQMIQICTEVRRFIRIAFGLPV